VVFWAGDVWSPDPAVAGGLELFGDAVCCGVGRGPVAGSRAASAGCDRATGIARNKPMTMVAAAQGLFRANQLTSILRDVGPEQAVAAGRRSSSYDSCSWLDST
jgi:hypothetical protein